MNREYCIFKEKKPCDNCGECERCDLSSNKKCNNCGKCLEKDGFDMKGIKIDEIIENEGEAEEYNSEKANGQENSDSYDNHYQLQKGDLYEDEDIQGDYLDDYDDKEEKTYKTLEEIYAEDNLEDENMEYIDDVEGLSDLLEDDERLSEIICEEFPGFIRIKKDNKR